MDTLDTHWLTVEQQNTLRQSIWCRGVGLHSGTFTEVSLEPAPVDHGIVFRIMDNTTVLAEIPAHAQFAKTGFLRTVLQKQQHCIDTIEHLMAALHAYSITNCLIKVWGKEIPIFDGSASSWTFLIFSAGIEKQSSPARYIQVLKPLRVGNSDAYCSIEPYKDFRLSYDLNYSHPMIGQQNVDFFLDKRTFDRELANCRTFGFFKDLDLIQIHGLAKGVSLLNTVVFDETSLMADSILRWATEPARHKLVDAIGDLYLAGFPIIGWFKGFRSGHELNQQLISKLLCDSAAWCYTTMVSRYP